MSGTKPIRVMYPASLTPGGAERQMLLLAEHLPRDRFDVSFVLLARHVADGSLEAQRLGATVHATGAPRRAGLPMPVYGAKVARRVASYVALCRRERYDIVDAWLYLGYGLGGGDPATVRVPILIAGRRSLSAFKADSDRSSERSTRSRDGQPTSSWRTRMPSRTMSSDMSASTAGASGSSATVWWSSRLQTSARRQSGARRARHPAMGPSSVAWGHSSPERARPGSWRPWLPCGAGSRQPGWCSSGTVPSEQR